MNRRSKIIEQSATFSKNHSDWKLKAINQSTKNRENQGAILRTLLDKLNDPI